MPAAITATATCGVVSTAVTSMFNPLDQCCCLSVCHCCLQAIRAASARIGGLDGVTTFCELAVPLVARLSEALGLPGNTPEAVDIARDKVCSHLPCSRFPSRCPRSLFHKLSKASCSFFMSELCPANCHPIRSMLPVLAWRLLGFRRRAMPASASPVTWSQQPSMWASLLLLSQCQVWAARVGHGA